MGEPVNQTAYAYRGSNPWPATRAPLALLSHTAPVNGPYWAWATTVARAAPAVSMLSGSGHLRRLWRRRGDRWL